MRYSKFIIRNYRAINDILEIDVGKDKLMPIIGINESGKTTILHAIFSFDHFNDNSGNGRHIKDVMNLYLTSYINPTITAEITYDPSEIDSVEANIDNNKEYTVEQKEKFKKYNQILREKSTVLVTRNISTLKYDIDDLEDKSMIDKYSRELIGFLPYILFFDDFRDSIEDVILIKKDEKSSEWLSIMEELFNQTDETFSIFKLKHLEDRHRKSILSKVKRKLNTTLTKEWQNFRLDDRDALQISIDFETIKEGDTEKNYLRLEVIETDMNGDEHYFFIRDRSKGFFWFFNFVMKLEFNPKFLNVNEGNIYLLDEPGSYLHASAQSKLCIKLQQIAKKHNVIYCTHSHYLLNPEFIPLSSIKVADKDANGNVKCISIYDHKDNILERRSAFQPIIDALQIKPFLLDMNYQNIIITEGIFDYYILDMFKQNRFINILPSTGASSIQFYISLMIAWRINYVALWDNDDEGRSAKDKATTIFGKEIASRCFFLIPTKNNKKRIIQDLFNGNDIKMIKELLKLPNNSSFQKAITTLYYSIEKNDILNKISIQTKQNFSDLLDLFFYNNG